MSQVAFDTSPIVASSASGRPVRNYIPTLDGWRAVAILLVLLCHGADAMQDTMGRWSRPLTAFWKDHGLVGVRIFFAISGFLITSRLLDEMRQARPGILRRFYIRRAFRILPPALAYLLVLGVLGVAGLVDVRFRGWWASLLFMGNYIGGSSWYTGHFWSLAVEEHFYLLWPWLLVLCGMRGGARLATGIALAVVLWRAICFHFQWGLGEKFYGRTDIQLDGLLWGAVAACCYTHVAGRGWLSSLLPWPVGLILIIALGVSFAIRLQGWKANQALYAIQAFAMPLMLLATVLRPGSVLSWILESPPLTWLGRISYSVYLWQELFFAWNDARAPHLFWLQRWPLNLAAALGCALLSYHLLERPFIRLGSRLAQTYSPDPGTQ
jgi:peptidoglycan/LPS O-acetylase OafA/YrhL